MPRRHAAPPPCDAVRAARRMGRRSHQEPAVSPVQAPESAARPQHQSDRRLCVRKRRAASLSHPDCCEPSRPIRMSDSRSRRRGIRGATAFSVGRAEPERGRSRGRARLRTRGSTPRPRDGPRRIVDQCRMYRSGSRSFRRVGSSPHQHRGSSASNTHGHPCPGSSTRSGPPRCSRTPALRNVDTTTGSPRSGSSGDATSCL